MDIFEEFVVNDRILWACGSGCCKQAGVVTAVHSNGRVTIRLDSERLSYDINPMYIKILTLDPEF